MNWKKLELSDEHKVIARKDDKGIYHSDHSIFGTHDDSWDLVFIYNTRNQFVELGQVYDLIKLKILIEKKPKYYWINDYSLTSNYENLAAHSTEESAKYHLSTGGVTIKVMVVDE